MDDPFALPPTGNSPRPAVAGFAAALGSGAAPAPATGPENPALDHGISPLMAAANRLLLLVPPLRQTRAVADPAQLRATLAQAVRDFAVQAQQLGIAPERINAARYILCTVVDEAAAATPWGGSGAWGRHSLLAEFHGEVSGGEKVFQLMAMLAEKPDANRDLLELIYAALALGFEGRYGVNGMPGQLDAIRARLAQVLGPVRGAYAQALAENWRAAPAPPRRLPTWLPLAVAAAVAGLTISAVYSTMAYSLAQSSNPVFSAIQSLRLSRPVPTVVHLAPRPRLANFLEPEIKANLVSVQDAVDRSVVTVKGNGLFAPASDTLAPDRVALMRRIGEAMLRVDGNVVVAGYTDNTKIQSMRFPSNWHLSDARAKTVADLLASSGLPRERLRSEGRGDADPIAPNDSPANQALNRRVEITLFTAAAAPRSAAASSATP
jgi:type VI secretion system protein ImpK